MMQKFISITEAIVFAELFAEKNTDPATKIADGKIFTSTEGEPKNWFDEYVKKRGIETLGLEELVREIKEPERAAWKEKYMSGGSASEYGFSVRIVY